MARTSLSKKNNKGLSAVITTLILVAVSIVAVGLIWSFVQSIINKQIENSEACFGNYEKVQINKQYTCYEKVSADNYNLRFSLSIGDAEIDKVLVSVSSASAVKSYEITNTPAPVSGLMMYPSNLTNVSLPGKNSGLTYKAGGLEGKVDSIQIAPVIGGNLCQVSDSFSEIEDCALLI